MCCCCSVASLSNPFEITLAEVITETSSKGSHYKNPDTEPRGLCASS